MTKKHSREGVWQMFDSIAGRYDFINRLLSLRQDVRWRAKLSGRLNGTKLKALDLATGTGDVLLAMHNTSRIESGLGLDLSEKMLAVGQKKIKALGLENSLKLRRADALATDEVDGRYDVVTMSFGIRNVTRPDACLREMYRVLKSGAQVMILEFSLPSVRWLRFCYLWYLRHVLPVLGATVSGNDKAYRYLNETIETFPCGEAFCQYMREAGFQDVSATPMSFGIVTLYEGTRK